MLVATIIPGIVIIMLLFEKYIIQRGVRSLQLRIHVNGTRGKSSVTEYIAAGLSDLSPGIMAKITGIVPAIIINGEPHPIRRRGMARVQEQFHTILSAARSGAKSLVLECMSISPELQRLESRIFRPHIYVITNIRDDHREEMGENISVQVDSICSAIPPDCIVVTGEVRFLDRIREYADAVNSPVICARDPGPEIVSGIPDGVFAENVSLAMAVCELAGAEIKGALKRIKELLTARPSPMVTIRHDDREIRFLNAFAANDIDSTVSLLDRWLTATGHQGKTSILFNTRADRPVRTDLFAGWIAANSSSVDQVIITGDHSARARYSIIRKGFDSTRIHSWRRKQVKTLVDNLFSLLDDRSLVIGVGNISGEGLNIVKLLS